TPAIGRIHDVAGLEQAVVVVDEIGEPADRALRPGSRATGRGGRSIRVLLTTERISGVLGEVGRGFEGVFAPRVGGVRTNEVERHAGAFVEALPLRRGGDAVALAIEFLGA